MVSVAVDNGQQQPRLWVAKTAAPVFGEGRDTEERVVFRNRAKPPAGQHAYFVIHSFQPLADLPNRVARWEQDIRKDGPNFDDVLRALTAKIEASAGPLKWRVANPLRFEILEPVPPPEQEPSQ